MLKAGRTQTLTVNRISDYGLYLIDDEQNEVLLPNRYVSLANKVGDTLEVFVYHDSEDRLVATTETPKLREGEAGFLRVVDKGHSSTGACMAKTSSCPTATSREACWPDGTAWFTCM